MRAVRLTGCCVPQIRKSVRQGMRDIIQRVGVTSILVTHDQEEAFDIADQVVIFNRCAATAAGLSWRVPLPLSHAGAALL